VCAKDIDHLFHLQRSNLIVSLNNDQVLTYYALKPKKENQLVLVKEREQALFLDEIIDAKFVTDD
jgi:hypothetical protein